MATATLYSSLLMGWRSRWCWQTRMQHTTRWCQWCRCRDSCRQARPHRRLAPPSARLVRAKTASAECFLQQDWEWCPRSKASWSRPEPRTRKRAHVSWSEPCRKLWNKESCTGAAFKELKFKPKALRSIPAMSKTDQADQSQQHMLLVFQKFQQKTSFDRILESKQTCPEPGTHCKKGM